MSFSVGDVVVLKSGGPNMTVTKVTGDYITCTWFANGKPESCGFPANSLGAHVEHVPDLSQVGASF